MGKIWEEYGKNMGLIWEEYGNNMGIIWEEYGKNMGRIWEYGHNGNRKKFVQKKITLKVQECRISETRE